MKAEHDTLIVEKSSTTKEDIIKYIVEFIDTINLDYNDKGRKVDVIGVGTISEGPHYDGLFLKIYNKSDEMW